MLPDPRFIIDGICLFFFFVLLDCYLTVERSGPSFGPATSLGILGAINESKSPFCYFFQNNHVGRVNGNETFYGDGVCGFFLSLTVSLVVIFINIPFT